MKFKSSGTVARYALCTSNYFICQDEELTMEKFMLTNYVATTDTYVVPVATYLAKFTVADSVENSLMQPSYSID